jgi:hypothetical protein
MANSEVGKIGRRQFEVALRTFLYFVFLHLPCGKNCTVEAVVKLGASVSDQQCTCEFLQVKEGT